MTQTEQKVKSIVADKLGVDLDQVVPTANIADDLGADSLDSIELVMELEKEFNIRIPDEEAEKVVTIQDLTKLVEDRIAGTPGY